LVVNGENIPEQRSKYWVPYGCRTTYWDLDALQRVAATAKSGSTSELRCNLPMLRRVVFTGRSVMAVLMAAMREHILKEPHEIAKRDKERDQLLESTGAPLAVAKLDLAAGSTLEFVAMGQTMPVIVGRDPIDVDTERHQQIQAFVKEFQPSAFVLHVGLHEVCGAYGPEYMRNRLYVGHCASRDDLVDTYRGYAAELERIGMNNRTIFRSLMGGFPDIGGAANPWRWQGFADELPTFPGGSREQFKGNPCPMIAAPISNTIFGGGDAAAAWDASGVRVADAFSPFHASPTRFQVMHDGLHPNTDSDEALAVNQLIMNGLCSMGISS
jgi:hypothetical protein